MNRARDEHPARRPLLRIALGVLAVALSGAGLCDDDVEDDVPTVDICCQDVSGPPELAGPITVRAVAASLARLRLALGTVCGEREYGLICDEVVCCQLADNDTYRQLTGRRCQEANGISTERDYCRPGGAGDLGFIDDVADGGVAEDDSGAGGTGGVDGDAGEGDDAGHEADAGEHGADAGRDQSACLPCNPGNLLFPGGDGPIHQISVMADTERRICWMVPGYDEANAFVLDFFRGLFEGSVPDAWRLDSILNGEAHEMADYTQLAGLSEDARVELALSRADGARITAAFGLHREPAGVDDLCMQFH